MKHLIATLGLLLLSTLAIAGSIDYKGEEIITPAHSDEPLPGELAGIFRRTSPVTPGNDIAFPRVAFEIMGVPSKFKAEKSYRGGDHKHQNWALIRGNTDDCYRVQATVWNTKENLTKVPFTWCNKTTRTKDPDYNPTHFYGFQNMVLSQNNTGTVPTNGPVPPSTFWPNDLDNKEFMPTDFIVAKIGNTHTIQDMMFELFDHMRYNQHDPKEARVWVSNFAQAAGPLKSYDFSFVKETSEERYARERQESHQRVFGTNPQQEAAKKANEEYIKMMQQKAIEDAMKQQQQIMEQMKKNGAAEGSAEAFGNYGQ